MGTRESAASIGQFGIGGPGGIAKNAENREKLPAKSDRLKGDIGNVSEKANMNAKGSSLDRSFLQSDDANSSDGSNEASNHDGSHILQNGSGRTPAFNGFKEQSSGLPSEKNSSNAQAFGVKTSFAIVTNEDHHLDRTVTQIFRPTIAVKTALPTANLNMVLGYWNGSTPGASPGKSLEKSKSDLRNGPAVSPILATISSDGIYSDLCLQDERELKRQRRKQANRESARRSRLRKQAEYEELAGRVELLTNENSSLRVELNRLKELCFKLSSENSSLQEQVLKAQCKTGDSQT